MTGVPPSRPEGSPSALWEVLYTAAERLDDPAARRPDPVGEYNTRPGATVQDLIALLEDVRARIQSRMRR